MIKSWEKLNLSWLGRVTAIKMTALPLLLYLFRTLPTSPPKGSLKPYRKLLTIEQDSMPEINLRNLLWLTNVNVKSYSNPIIAHSMKLWSQAKGPYNLVSPHKPAMCLLNYVDFPPGMSARAFSWWEQSHLTTIHSFTRTNKLVSFPHLQSTYKAPQSECLRYSQISHYIKSLHEGSVITLPTAF
ncbi:hypothetical protein XELAEV_18020177mg [Xenopus laevis]|uniref:Uncharacterized protein n=1 Tax=Xenopus laevis TaxID=8355 RepID=A0A974HQ92_XENLA|nr:hypothetical protein XELAEV_18020177mg [Xenopus laevis]